MRKIYASTFITLATSLLFLPPLFADEAREQKKKAGATARMIDARIDRAMQDARLMPAPRASNHSLIRRLSLDLNGVIPRSKDLTRFARAKSLEPYIESLISDPSFATRFSNLLTRGFVGRKRDQNAIYFRDWLRDQISRDQPYDAIVRAIISAQPQRRSDQGNGAAYFLRRWDYKVPEVAAQSARVFLGLQIQCAQCHDHPFSDWKQQQFHSYAAYFSRGPYQYKVEKTQRYERFAPRFLFDLESKGQGQSTRQEVAALITHKENPYFSKMIVNRIWKALMGRGLVEPHEDLEASPGSHPQLLAFLAADFVANNHSLKHLVRAIVLTRAYQRGSKRPADQKDPARALEDLGPGGDPEAREALTLAVFQEQQLFARATLRPLSPEQIVASLLRATGRERLLTLGSKKTRRLAKIRFDYLQGKLHSQFESLYDDSELSPDFFEGTIPQALILLNGRFINEAIEAEDGTFMESLTRAGSRKTLIKKLFLQVLSRPPEKDEVTALAPFFKDKSQRASVAEDLMWALMNSSEWLTNH